MTRSSSASNSTTTSTPSPYKAIMNNAPKSKRRKKPLTAAMLKRTISSATTDANESDNDKTSINNDVASSSDCTKPLSAHSPLTAISTSTSTKKKKKKSKNKGKSHDEFWSNNSNTEERQKIREFWLQLREDERRSLVKVEKEAVLRKMKEQQRHSCNCSVCGKKR